MDLKDIVSISGMGGLFRIEAQRDNGIVVKPFGDERRKFVSSRQHMFTPLENITIYDSGEGVELSKVLKTMKQKATETAPPDPNAGNEPLKTYFGTIVPEFDRDKVYVSDIKKILKWFTILDDAGLITTGEGSEEVEPNEEAGSAPESSNSDKE